jgi:hypothetical protein
MLVEIVWWVSGCEWTWKTLRCVEGERILTSCWYSVVIGRHAAEDI